MTPKAPRYPHVAAAILDTPWLITPHAMQAIIEVLERRIEGERLSEIELAERLMAGRQRLGPRDGPGRRAGAVQVIPIYGILAQRASYFEETSSGGTAVESIQKQFRAALADPEVAGILFDVDSPGGHVAGILELAAEIRAARGQKPMVAISNTFMASAAYYLGSQADEVVVTPSSMTGSIGVVMGHRDFSKQEEMLGVKTTLIHAGKFKVETSSSVALSEDALAHLQGLVDETYGTFVGDVAKGRGVSAARVRADFGEGRVFSPRKAVEVGMADRVGTYDDAVLRLSQGKVQPRSSASAELPAEAAIAATMAQLAPLGELGAFIAPTVAAEAEDLLMHGNGTGEAPADADVPRESTEPAAEPDPSIEIARARARSHSR